MVLKNGMGIIIAGNYGAKNEDQLRKSSPQLLLLWHPQSLVIFIGAVGLPMLQFLGTPSAIVISVLFYISTIVNGVAVPAYNLR